MTVSLVKPVVGASPGTWGTLINTALDALAAETNAHENTVVDPHGDRAFATAAVAANSTADRAFATAADVTAAALASATYAPISGSAIYSAKRSISRFRRPLMQVPAVAASPPTVATSSSYSGGISAAHSSITSAVSYSVFTDGLGGTLNPKFTNLGWPYAAKFSTVGECSNKMTTLQNAGFPNFLEVLYASQVATPIIEFGFYADSGLYKIWVDGLPVTATTQTGPFTNTGVSYNIVLTFPAPGQHVISVQGTHGLGLLGVNIGPTDSLFPSPVPAGPQILVLGDSYADGANGVLCLDTYPHLLAQLMDTRNLWVDGQGGTGIVANGGIGTKSAYLARLQADVVLPGLVPDVVIIQGSTNDGSSSGATITAATTALIAQVRTSWPRALCVVTGVLVPEAGGSLTAGNITNNTAVRTAAVGVADLFIDAVADTWFTGSGQIGTLTGSGNADVFRSNDAVHPTAAGHLFIAQQMQQYLTRALAA